MVGALGAILAGAGGGLAAGAGSSLINLALIGYTGANTFINSYYFGYGMILGERDMYQNDWPKIQDRIAKGEPFLQILEEKMREKTHAIMALAGDIQLTVEAEYAGPMLQRLLAKPGEAFTAILNYLGFKGDVGAQTEADFIEHLKADKPHSDVGLRPHTHGTSAGIPDILPSGDDVPPPGQTGKSGKSDTFNQKPLAPASARALYMKTKNQMEQVQVAINQLYKNYQACRASGKIDKICRLEASFKLMTKLTSENNQRRIANQTLEKQYRDLP